MKEEIRKLYDKTKEEYQGMLSPSEQSAFWSTFGYRVFIDFLFDSIRAERKLQTMMNEKSLYESDDYVRGFQDAIRQLNIKDEKNPKIYTEAKN